MKDLCIYTFFLILLSGCNLKFSLNQISGAGDNRSTLALIDDSLALALNATNTIDVLANDNLAGLELTGMTVIEVPPQVTVTILNASQFEISSSGGYQGDVIIEYQAVDALGQSGSARLTVNVGYCSGERLADTPFANSSLGVDGLSTPQAFTICSFEQFNQIGAANANWDKFYELRYDIDFQGTTWDDYNPIGDLVGDAFTGDFNGVGFSINNINWVLDPGAGNDVEVALFHQTNNAFLYNFSVPNVQILYSSGDSADTAVVVSLSANTTLQDIHVSCTVDIPNGGYNNLAGLVASSTTDNVEGSSAEVNLTTTSVFGGDFLGGLIALANTTSVTSSSATLSATASGATIVVGGLIGAAATSSIMDSSASVDIDMADGINVGGLVGQNIFGPIDRSYASGSIEVTDAFRVAAL